MLNGLLMISNGHWVIDLRGHRLFVCVVCCQFPHPQGSFYTIQKTTQPQQSTNCSPHIRPKPDYPRVRACGRAGCEMWPSKFKWNSTQINDNTSDYGHASQPSVVRHITQDIIFSHGKVTSPEIPPYVLLEATIDTNINLCKLIGRVPYYVLSMIQWFTIVGWFACDVLLVHNAKRYYW